MDKLEHYKLMFEEGASAALHHTYYSPLLTIFSILVVWFVAHLLEEVL